VCEFSEIFVSKLKGTVTSVSAEKFLGGGVQWKIQDREIALISVPLLYQG